MPPTRGKRGRRESLTGITRSHTNASDPRGIPDVVTSPATVSAMGQPPPQCLKSVDFADDPGLRAVVSGSRTTWERNMELRMCASEKVVGEIHAMLVEMRPAPVVSLAPAALGSAAQLVDIRPLLLCHQHRQRWAARLKHLMRSLLGTLPHSQPRLHGRLWTLTCQVQLRVWSLCRRRHGI